MEKGSKPAHNTRFFDQIGYKETQLPGDCTPWCAATVAWCLWWAGPSIPRNPASALSYLAYGKEVTDRRPGDLCLFSGVSDASNGHIGLYVSRVGEKLRFSVETRRDNRQPTADPAIARAKYVSPKCHRTKRAAPPRASITFRLTFVKFRGQLVIFPHLSRMAARSALRHARSSPVAGFCQRAMRSILASIEAAVGANHSGGDSYEA